MSVHFLLLPILNNPEAFNPVVGVQQHVLFLRQNLDSVYAACNNLFPGVLIFLIDVNNVHVSQHVSRIQSTFALMPGKASVNHFLGVL